MAKLIVIDGLDGSGKATQANKLFEYFKKNKYNAYKISFPAYESPSSTAVQMYLNGELGSDPLALNPYMCSTFYAVDRAIQYTKTLKGIFDQPDAVIVADRYISANIIHQGGKIQDICERKKFFQWAYDFETNLMKIPRDDITIFLDVPVWKSQELMLQRYNGNSEKRDIHEASVKYLEMCHDSANTAVDILRESGYNWVRVNCLNRENNLRTVDDIFNSILKLAETVM